MHLVRSPVGPALAAIAGALLGCAQPGVAPSSGADVADDAQAPVEVALARGGLIGRYLDEQATELDALEGAEVERRTDAILVRLPAAGLFDPGAATLAPGARARLRALAGILNAHSQSHLIVKGHGDPAADEDSAQRLSEERAWRVRDLLRLEGVHPSRMSAIGFGATVPLASNATEAGRLRNRRVEIEIRPHDEVLRQGNIR